MKVVTQQMLTLFKYHDVYVPLRVYHDLWEKLCRVAHSQISRRRSLPARGYGYSYCSNHDKQRLHYTQCCRRAAWKGFHCKQTAMAKPQDKTNPPDEEDDLEEVTAAPGCDDSECISVSCSTCRQTIHPSHLLHHKKAHRALTLLDFDSPQARTDKKALLAQRQRVISKLSEMPQHSETQRQKIDYSFEFLTGDHAPTSHCSLDTTNNPRTLRVSTSFVRALSVCQDSNSTWQGHMQDRFTVLDNYGNRSETCLLGLAGGSHGVAAAETVAAELPLLLLDQLAQTDSSYRKSEDEQQILDSFGTVFGADYRERESLFADELGDGRSGTYERIHKAHAKAFWRMDRLLRLGRNEVSKVRWSGCSAVTCLVERSPSQQTSSTEEEDRKLSESSAHSLLDGTARGVAGLLHVANTGNAHAVLCRNGKSHCLSREHSTSNAAERRRILQSGGNISTNEPDGLVEGCLKTTRALGYHGDPALKRCVIPVPHVVSVPIDDTCQFLILASSGLWEVLDYREVVALTLAAFTRYSRAYESVRPDSASPCKRHSLVPLAEDNLKDSNVTDDLQDETEILYSSQGTQVSDSKGNLTQNQPGGSRRSYLQSGGGVPKETDDHNNPAGPELILCSNNEVNAEIRQMEQPDRGTESGSEELNQSQDRAVYLGNSPEAQPETAEQQETDTDTLCVAGLSHTNKELLENNRVASVVATEAQDMKEAPKNPRACLPHYDSGQQPALKMDTRLFCDEPASYAAEELPTAASPAGYQPPPHLEEDTTTYPCNCKPNPAGAGQVPSATLYDSAASYISKQLVMTALAAGSRESITVLIALLSGCDKIPTSLNT